MLAITSIPTLSRFLNPDTFSRLSLLWMASKPVGEGEGGGVKGERGREEGGKGRRRREEGDCTVEDPIQHTIEK